MTGKTDIFRNFIHSVWLFPTVLMAIVIGLSVFKISGTSVGMYHRYVYGDQAKDPDLLFGYSRPVRSDEWLVNTQLTIAQSQAGFPHINHNLGSGRDMSLAGDVPYKDWSAAFRPQNLPFFILPLEFAFALKWWLLLYLVIVGCYFFCLRVLPKKRLFAVIFSLAIGFSPFFFWWYLSGTIATFAYGFFIMIIAMRLINGESVAFLKHRKLLYSNIIHGTTLIYLLTSFALVLYPPYQIPVAVVVFFFVLGYLLSRHFEHRVTWHEIGRKIAWLTVSLVIAGVLIGLFVETRKDAINAMTHTVYPGARVSTSGGINSLNIFDSFLQPQLESEFRGNHFFNNQSEASNFILLSPFLALPALAMTVYEYIRYRRFDWLFAVVQTAVLLLFARIFLPFGDRFYKILLLDKVPHERLVIGIGLASILLTLLIYKKLLELKISRIRLTLLAALYSLICFGIVIYIGFRVSHLYPLFISYTPKILLLAAAFTSIIYLFLIKRGVFAAIILLIFSFVSVVKVNPLYRGLGWIDHNDVLSHMQAVSKHGDTWVSGDDGMIQNFGLLVNRDSLSGVQPYPDLKLWRQLSNDEGIYNRYARVIFVSNPPWPESIRLIYLDSFEVAIKCNQFITNHVDYVLNVVKMSQPCLELKDQVSYPAVNFYIYQVNHS